MWEIRLFDTSSPPKRQPVPYAYVVSCDPVSREDGGYESCELVLVARYEDTEILSFMDSEPGPGWRLDVLQDGVYLWRGWCNRAQRGITDGVPTLELSFVGLLERLDRILVDGVFIHAGGCDITEAFAWLWGHYCAGTDALGNANLADPPNFPGTITDLATPVGVTVERAEFLGSTAREAFDNLVAASGGLIIWGVDVNAVGINRFYVRAKPKQEDALPRDDYILSVGGDMSLFQQTTDATGIVNSIRLYGAKAKAPNLVYNGSFEIPMLPGETAAGNLVTEPGFELSGGWTYSTNAARYQTGRHLKDGEYARSGSYFAELDGVGEYIEQDVSITLVEGQSTPFLFSLWAATEHPTNAGTVRISIRGVNGSGTAVEALLGDLAGVGVDYQVPAREYQEIARQVLSVTDHTVVALRIRLTYSTTLGAAALMIDDVLLARNDCAGTDKWFTHARGTGFAVVDWTCKESPYHGSYCVRLRLAGCTDAQNCLWLLPTDDQYSNGRALTAYQIHVALRSSQAVDFCCGLNYQEVGGQNSRDDMWTAGVLSTAGDGQWHTFISTATLNAKAQGTFRPFLAFTFTPPTGATVDVDAFVVREHGLTTDPLRYYDEDAMEWRFRVDNQGPSTVALPAAGEHSLTAEAQQSIARFGLREEEVEAPEIDTDARAKQYGAAYLNTHAVEELQGQTTLEPCRLPIRYVETDNAIGGYLGIVGLKVPLTQFPARLRYSLRPGGNVRLDIDLTRPRLDPALLLKDWLKKLVTRGRRSGSSVKGGSGTSVDAARLTALHFGPDEAGAFQRLWDAVDDLDAGTPRTGGTRTLTLYAADGVTAHAPEDGTVVLVFLDGTLSTKWTRTDSTIAFVNGYHPINNERVTVLYYPGA